MSNILIIAEFIAPVQSIGSLRWTKLGKYLSKNHGHNIYILTNTKDYDGKCLGDKQYDRDAALSADLDHFSGYLQFDTPAITRPINRLFNLGRKAKRRALLSPLQAFGEEALPVDPSHCSKRSKRIDLELAKRALRVGRRRASLCREGHCAEHFPAAAFERYMRAVAEGEVPSCDLVISTYGPTWPHATAALIKQSAPSHPWIADFRDPPRVDFAEPGRYIRSFPCVYASADLVSLVSRPIEDHLYIGAGQAVLDLSNGFDPEDAKGRVRSRQSKFRLVYTGTLYSHAYMQQNLSPAFDAIEQLQAAGRIDIEDIEICYAGSAPDIFQAQVEHYPNLVPRVKNFGLLSRREAMDLQDTASVLLAATWNTEIDRGVTTGKIWEYLLSGAPILGTCTGDVPNPYLGEVVDESGAGAMVEEVRLEATLPRAVDFLAALYGEWKQTGTTTAKIDRAYVDQFSYPVLAERLNNVIEGLLDSAPRY